MNYSDCLLIGGVLLLSMGLRTTGSQLLGRLGVLGYLASSFLAGWLLTGWWPMGLVFLSFWLVWPWYELITRVRKIVMPEENALRHKTPPHRELFPARLYAITNAYQAVFTALFGPPVVEGDRAMAWNLDHWNGQTEVGVEPFTWPSGQGRGGPTLPIQSQLPPSLAFSMPAPPK
ncbi:MAG: hypothetical protein ABMA01_12810 [Chthoniobacteraceae bacterium]